MIYHIPYISSVSQLDREEPFFISHALWNTACAPRSYGYLGLIKDVGFAVKLVCEETDPLRTFIKPNDPVYKDSALEAFFQFQPGSKDYFNFEMNGNGTLLAQWGENRLRRNYLPGEHMELCTVTPVLCRDKWSVTLTVPFSLLRLYYPGYQPAGPIRCNFYKICETPSNLHFLSWSPIDWETPDFHLPQFFGRALVRG